MLQQVNWVDYHIDYSANKSIQQESGRFRFFKLQGSHVDAETVVGSTFTTNRANMLHQNTGSHVLDACYAAYILDDDKRISGLVIAGGDGCGGHFGDEYQDKAISRTVQFACKQAARLLALAPDAETIVAQRIQLVAAIGHEVRVKTPDWYESTTLVAAARKLFAPYTLRG